MIAFSPSTQPKKKQVYPHFIILPMPFSIHFLNIISSFKKKKQKEEILCLKIIIQLMLSPKTFVRNLSEYFLYIRGE